MFRSLVLAGVVVSTATVAQPSVSASGVSPRSRWTDEAAQVRLHYGAAIRFGAEDDGGPGLSYSGPTPNDLAATAWAWLLLGGHLGLTGSFAREAFSLRDGPTVVTQGALIRFHVGPTGRVRLGPVRLELAAAYAFHQLPVFGTINDPVFSAQTRHGILIAARGLVDLGPVTVEARGEFTPALNQVAAASSLGFGVGGGVRVNLFRTGPLKWGLLAEVTWHSDSLRGMALTANQSVIRAGGALDLQWKDPALDKDVTTGSLRVLVKSDQGALAGAEVAVDVGATHRTFTTDARGEVAIDELEPGEVVAAATLAGYERGESRSALGVGETRTLELVLSKERPKVGSLVVKVVNFDGKGALSGATIELNGTTQLTSAAGSASFEALKPGPLAVKVTAPGFTPGEEAASIVAGSTAELVVTLVPEKKKVPATLSGLVRSARGGKPIAAQLEIKELKQNIACTDAGTFSVQIPGGKYVVRISATGFVTQTKSVTVKDGDQAIFNIDLAPK